MLFSAVSVALSKSFVGSLHKNQDIFLLINQEKDILILGIDNYQYAHITSYLQQILLHFRYVLLRYHQLTKNLFMNLIQHHI